MEQYVIIIITVFIITAEIVMNSEKSMHAFSTELKYKVLSLAINRPSPRVEQMSIAFIKSTQINHFKSGTVWGKNSNAFH